MAIFLDCCRGATFSYVRGSAEPVARRSLRFVGRRSPQDALRDAMGEDTDSSPVCPHCSCPAVYTYQCRRVFKCKACHRQFSVTSGTLLGYRKLPFRTLLMAFSLFVNAAKGLNSLQLSRNLGLHAKTAFVLLHKLRCALTSNSATTTLNGIVEIDGGWFGGRIRPKIIESLALIGVGANTKMASASALWSCVSVAARP